MEHVTEVIHGDGVWLLSEVFPEGIAQIDGSADALPGKGLVVLHRHVVERVLAFGYLHRGPLAFALGPVEVGEDDDGGDDGYRREIDEQEVEGGMAVAPGHVHDVEALGQIVDGEAEDFAYLPVEIVILSGFRNRDILGFRPFQHLLHAAGCILGHLFCRGEIASDIGRTLTAEVVHGARNHRVVVAPAHHLHHGCIVL